jgi:hypothetical protein
VSAGPDDDGPVGDGVRGPTLRERLSNLFLKAPPPGSEPAPVAPPPTVEELEDANRYADDKERLIGLLAAPVAALIGILIVGADISNDPAATFANGTANAAHVSHSLYSELLIVLLVLAVAMLAAAWFRKRLYLGVVLALYGLTVFNLKYWGFGLPFLLFGAWLLVRAYRAQKALKLATGDTGRQPSSDSGRGSSAPRRSKRYTPPTAKPKRPAKPEDEQKAG